MYFPVKTQVLVLLVQQESTNGITHNWLFHRLGMVHSYVILIVMGIGEEQENVNDRNYVFRLT